MPSETGMMCSAKGRLCNAEKRYRGPYREVRPPVPHYQRQEPPTKGLCPRRHLRLEARQGRGDRTAPTRHSVARRRAGNARHILAFFNKLPPCLVGVEACASSRLPPAYVKPYVKRQKNETADAEAICKAVS